MFADNMLLNVEKPKDSYKTKQNKTKKQLVELINKFSKVAG